MCRKTPGPIAGGISERVTLSTFGARMLRNSTLLRGHETSVPPNVPVLKPFPDDTCQTRLGCSRLLPELGMASVITTHRVKAPLEFELPLDDD